MWVFNAYSGLSLRFFKLPGGHTHSSRGEIPDPQLLMTALILLHIFMHYFSHHIEKKRQVHMQIQLITMFNLDVLIVLKPLSLIHLQRRNQLIVALFWCYIQRQSTSGKKMVLTVKAELKLFSDKHLNMQPEQMHLWRKTYRQIIFFYLAFALILKLLVQIT